MNADQSKLDLEMAVPAFGKVLDSMVTLILR